MTDKLQIIAEIYKACYGNESFYDIGPELAFTTQAILVDQRAELNPIGPFVRLLQSKISSCHAVWDHIKLEPTVVCISCETEVLWDQASYCPPLSGWLGHNCCVDASENEAYYEEVEVAFT